MTGQTHPHPDPPLEGEGIKRGTNTAFPIVGIGASAGGLDALQRFLAVLPQDFGFALVFIQHLSSKHKSLLPELLAARRPSLVIQEISDGLKAQPGRLYLSPPGREVRIRNGIFWTTVHPEGLIHLPIDEFLVSLAEDADGRSIAVIFSGAGTDGARGCQAVRTAGGTVFVQDPETAEFSSMPLAAIATGQADAVLSPEDICRELLKVQGTGAAAVSREYPITPEEFDAFFRLLRDKTGSRFTHYKKSVVGRRIKRRMYLYGLSSIKDYLDLISARDAEAALLASDLMIGVTSFFRDRVAWKALSLEAVRKIVAENTDLPVRVWTPATATGEEAYSIAVMLLRELDLAGKKRDVQVFATDVNDRALERAREGKYPASISADVPQEYIQKYFTSTDDGNVLIINKEVRESVVFAKQDLLSDPPFSKLDLIICRNFMIYLEPEAQEKCITLFHYALKDSGFLFLGNAETVGRNSRLFQSVGRKPCRVYQKLETKPASRLPISVPYAAERRAAPQARQTQIAGQGQSATEIVQEKLLEEYGPASVAIDQHHEIIYHNGPTNKYLRQPRGVPTQNLLELLPDSLRSRIRGALYRSGREERPVVIRTSVAGDDNKKRHITLRITKAAENLYIVVFLEKGAPSKKEVAEQVDSAVIEETAIHQLESELSATRADLQTHIEQLKSLNEELQSANEELQAANEELETSREELQSLNEELITVNSQLQGKIEEQDVTNNDLNNFLASTNIPTIFLDMHFRVKRFTPAMLKLIKLLPSDVGRPIVDMSQENLGPDLTIDARSVLESLVPARQELEINGEWYVRTTLPYRTADNRIEGVVVTYNDVSDLKKSEERTRHLASFPELNPNPVCEVHSSGKIVFCNPATVKVLANLGMDTEDLNVFMPEDMDDILRNLVKKEEASLYREKEIKDRVYGMTVHLTPQFNVVRIYAYDITERKRAAEALRASEEQFRTLADSIPNLTWWANADGYITWYNRRWYEFTGTTPEQMEGWGWQSVHDPNVLPNVLERWKASIATGVPFDMEFPLRGADGIFRSFLTRVVPMKDSAGRVLRWFGTNTDISALKKAEESLRESETRVRLKLDSILSPEGDIGDLDLSDVIDAGAVQTLMDDFYKLAHMPMSIIDLKGSMLVGVGWQKICTEFHRVHPETCRNCIESDLQLSAGVPPGEFKLYKCKNNMWDVATPIIVGGKHMGNLFMGQFFFEDEPLDYEFFRAQAGQYGFDEKEYITALETVPRLSREALNTSMAFFLKLADVLSKSSYSNLKLARSLAHRDALTSSLRESENSLKRAQEISHLGSWELDLVNNRLTWSDEVYRIFGLQPQEFGATYEAFLERVHPDDRAAVDAAYSGSIREGKDTYEIEHKVVRKATGEIRYVHEKCQHFRDETGRIIQSIGMVHDITERKQAEDALRDSETKYRSLFENMIDGLAYHRVITDENGKPVDYVFLETNEAFERLTGLKRADIIGKSVREALPGIENDPADWIGTYGKVALTGQEVRFQHYAVQLGKWYSVSAYSPMKGYFVTIFEDVTESKKAEVALRESEERFRSMFERHQAVMLLIEPGSGAIVDANAAASRFYGYSREQLRSMRIQDINQLKPEDVAAERKLAAEEKRNNFIFPHLLADGLVRWVEVYSTPFEAQGRPLLFSVIHDITERKQAEADLLKLSEDMAARNLELESANKEMESFIYSISHDLRAPIRTVSGFAKIIVEDYLDKLDEQGRDYLNRILKGSEKSTQLIDDLLRLSKIARQDLDRSEVDLSRVASSIVSDLRLTHPDRSVETVIAEGLAASADLNLIKVALSNLLENAWKFTSKTAEARIEFGTFVEEGKAVYYVKDNGAGFDPEYADRMFWPFHRLHSDSEFEGTGIGLAIVERVIRRHGGRVWAEGASGKGATFYFTLG